MHIGLIGGIGPAATVVYDMVDEFITAIQAVSAQMEA